MIYLFKGCSSLLSLPDISKWNITIAPKRFIPEGGSTWDMSTVNKMHSIFEGCSSLSSLPDVPNLNTYNFSDINSMFNECYNPIILEITKNKFGL